jgi:hypothetical protein
MKKSTSSMTLFRLLLILCLTLTAPSIYSQSLDSLPLKELNNEFLKGIKARERVVVLKTVIHLDSQQISLYKDSIVPSYQQMIEVSKKEVYDLNRTIDRKDAEMKLYKYGFVGMSILAILGFIL